jgi:hypothetical protein
MQNVNGSILLMCYDHLLYYIQPVIIKSMKLLYSSTAKTVHVIHWSAKQVYLLLLHTILHIDATVGSVIKMHFFVQYYKPNDVLLQLLHYRLKDYIILAYSWSSVSFKCLLTF